MGERRRSHRPIRHEIRHGSTSRANRPVPAHIDHVRQSNQDRAALQQLLFERHLERENAQRTFGNKELPAYKHKAEIIDLVDTFRASVIGGETGSGKSTQVPQFLYEAGYEKIYVLVPRRVIANNLYDRLREEMSQHLSEEELADAIGVRHGERNEANDNNRIVIMTPNSFLRAGNDISKDHGDKKVAIIADEMHEANVYTEIAAGIGLQSVEEHPEWRFVAMSATHNEDVLRKPLQKVNGNQDDAILPSVTIEGRPYTITHNERPKNSAWEVYARECQEEKVSMIFTSGKAELDHIIEKTRAQLEQEFPGGSRDVVFRKLHGELTEKELEHVTDPIPEGKRLVIVATPAGMSGITIPGLTCIISDGTINRGELDDDDIEGLSRAYLSKAGIIQQFGRGGRDVPGGKGYLVKPVMIEEDKILDKGQAIDVEAMPYIHFDKREEFEPPEIYSMNLSGIVLTVANLGQKFTRLNEYLPHRVTPTAITKANQALMRLMALDNELNITGMGRLMNKFQVRPELSRGIAESLAKGRSLLHMARMALIVSAVEAGGVQDFSDRSNKRWKHLLDPETSDDMVAQLDIVTSLPAEASDAFPYFLRENDLNYKRVVQAQKVAQKIMKSLGITPENVVHAPVNQTELYALRDDIAAGMIDSIYEYSHNVKERAYYRNIHADDPKKIRLFSQRSIADAKSHHIAAFPRWYKKHDRKGGRVKYDIVEQIMPVHPRIIGEYAAKADLLVDQRVELARSGKTAMERVQPMFGSIAVGDVKLRQLGQIIPKDAQEFVVNNVLRDKEYNQRALREVAAELEKFIRAVPMETLKSLQLNDGEFITQDKITKLIRLYAERTADESEIDRLIGEHIYKNNLGIDYYFDAETRQWLHSCSVAEIEVDGQYFKLSYLDDDTRTPYITMPSRERHKIGVLKRPEYRDALTLPDGRSVCVQVMRDGKKVQLLPIQL